jgi:hypothetical protein
LAGLESERNYSPKEEAEVMTQSSSVQSVIEQIGRLSQEEKAWVREWLDREGEEKEEEQGGVSKTGVRFKIVGVNPKTAAAMKWIREHSMEHPGEWLALDGNVLIATGKSFKEVTEAAEAIGALSPLYHLVRLNLKHLQTKPKIK